MQTLAFKFVVTAADSHNDGIVGRAADLDT